MSILHSRRGRSWNSCSPPNIQLQEGAQHCKHTLGSLQSLGDVQHEGPADSRVRPQGRSSALAREGPSIAPSREETGQEAEHLGGQTQLNEFQAR